ncbi:hypothetical protein [Dactylosporangium fulvum]|uniref:Secreted protein n=1 Tax=Dactylosporangium fulvum TaxID=53359 RepID=A0ABY5WAS1_9ACTN|nr:hypothetical protein [Dactylosporangium fulvum]UWP86637.1 hypothetical protein Dfulv_21315 [Dactylosporangium fulvum]
MRHTATVDDRVDFQPTEISESVQTYGLEDHSDTFGDAVADLNGKIPNVHLTDVIQDVNHSAKAPCGVPPTADSVRFCWNDEDNAGTTWIPQGLTGSWDADADGRWNGHQVIAATWYDDRGVDGTNRGSRITFVNYDEPGKPEYRHVLLVVPDRDGSFHAAKSHVGGVAWVGYRLYVADTDAIRVFDLHNIWRTRADSSHKKIGMDDGKAYAADYRYAIPQIGYYTPDRPLRISSISLDRTSSPNSLITAEYKQDRDGVHSPRPANTRIVRWNLGKDGKLAATSSAAYVTSRANVNGAITYGDKPEFVLTSSEFNRRPAWIHRATVGTSSRYTSVRLGGPEDLTYQPQGSRMWTLTEYDGRRSVFGIPLSSIGNR